MQSIHPEVSVVVMTFNEVATLEATVRELRDELVRLEVSFEVLIVDDGSSDGSSDLADSLAATLTAYGAAVRVVHHGTNCGLGGVYRTGFEEAAGRYITFFPADGQFPASIIKTFLAHIRDNDMVLGYLPGRRETLVGHVLSASERLLYRLLLGPFPRFQGVLMFRRVLLFHPLRSEGRGWGILMELIVRARRAGYRLESVPTPIRPRRAGASKVQNRRTILSNLEQLIALRRVL